MDKGMHPPFPKKGDLGIAKNYQGISELPKTTLTSIAANIYNVQPLDRIELEENSCFRRKSIYNIANSDNPLNFRSYSGKNLKTTL